MPMKGALVALLLSLMSLHASSVAAHRGNVEPDTGCHIEKASGMRHCHPERIHQSKEQIEQSLNKGKKHAKKQERSADR